MRNISGQLYTYLQSVQAYLAPPIAAVFLLGLFWPRINAKGAMAAMSGGFVFGMTRLVAELNVDSLEGPLHALGAMNFLHFAILLFGVCIVILVGVSLLTRPPSEEQLRGLTYSTTVAEDRERSRSSWNAVDVCLSLIIVVLIGLILIVFSPLGIGG